MSGRSTVGIEPGTIFQIPLDQRHGRTRDLFTVWFGANISILTVVTGALGPTAYGLNFVWSAVSIVVGNLLGGIFMALHAAQGPQLGVPQMVQTRGQFGSYGAISVICIVVVMYVGFIASSLYIGGQSIQSILPGANEDLCIVALCVLSLLAAMYGHDLIHLYTKISTVVSGLALVTCAVWIVFVYRLPDDFFSQGGFTAEGFVGNVSVSALWQIAFAPYVSDYSRYMAPGTGARHAFWASYAGSVLGAMLPMLLGACLACLVSGGDAVAALALVMGPLAFVIVPILAASLVGSNAINLYGGALSAITILQTFAPGWKVRPRHRIITAAALATASLVIAALSASNFMVAYTNFLSLLLYVLVPWTAINLVDFYLIQHGQYDVDAFFLRDGGIYGRYNVPALVGYVIGIAVQVPFMSTAIYTGPIAAMMGGADIAWIVGLVVISPLYWVIVRRRGVIRRSALLRGS